MIRPDTDDINQPRLARGNRQLKSAPIARKARVSTAIYKLNTYGGMEGRQSHHIGSEANVVDTYLEDELYRVVGAICSERNAQILTKLWAARVKLLVA